MQNFKINANLEKSGYKIHLADRFCGIKFNNSARRPEFKIEASYYLSNCINIVVNFFSRKKS